METWISELQKQIRTQTKTKKKKNKCNENKMARGAKYIVQISMYLCIFYVFCEILYCHTQKLFQCFI